MLAAAHTASQRPVIAGGRAGASPPGPQPTAATSATSRTWRELVSRDAAPDIAYLATHTRACAMRLSTGHKRDDELLMTGVVRLLLEHCLPRHACAQLDALDVLDIRWDQRLAPGLNDS